jgi:hypothetical protein
MATTYVKKISGFDENCYMGVFEVADCEFEVKIVVNKIADPIWWTHM